MASKVCWNKSKLAANLVPLRDMQTLLKNNGHQLRKRDMRNNTDRQIRGVVWDL